MKTTSPPPFSVHSWFSSHPGPSSSRSHLRLWGIGQLLPLALLLTSLSLLTGCGGGSASTSTVQVDGSSTVYPITEAVAEEFMKENPGMRVTVGVSGTGGGFSKFTRQETDVNNASRPVQPVEMETAEQNNVEFIELPVAYDGLAVLANPNNQWADCLTAEELRRIWEPGSDINNWSQVREGFPDRPLNLYGAGTDSGTYDYFTEAITGEDGASRADFTASEDDNVLVQGIAGDPNALGFFGLAYYEENQSRLKLLAVDNENPEDGEGCVLPSPETVNNGTYQPLSRPLFIYVRADRANDAAVNAFVEFYLNHAGQLAREVGYVSLSEQGYALTLERFQQGITGTMFSEAGSTVGVRIADLLQREQASLADSTATPAN